MRQLIGVDASVVRRTPDKKPVAGKRQVVRRRYVVRLATLPADIKASLTEDDPASWETIDCRPTLDKCHLTYAGVSPPCKGAVNQDNTVNITIRNNGDRIFLVQWARKGTALCVTVDTSIADGNRQLSNFEREEIACKAALHMALDFAEALTKEKCIAENAAPESPGH